MNFIDYREKLNIGFNDSRKTDYFTTYIFNALNLINSDNRLCEFTFAQYYLFCNLTGTELNSHLSNSFYTNDRFEHVLSVLGKHRKNIKDFLSYYLVLVKVMRDTENDNAKPLRSQWLLNLVEKALSEARIQYELIQDDEDYIIIPKGAAELDQALINEPLEWLEHYPEARKTFIIALKQYSNGEFIRDMADNLRKALETFLQEFLGNKNNLETNKNNICKYLGANNVDSGVIGLLQPLINAYKNINDRTAKHNDLVDEKILEFLLYQTGIFIRMIIQCKAE